ncbi:PepSY domain-containing protein [Novosphingobium sp. MMS21-SN21R]|uniref:PepSY domain-containing protein n=1 Tax=Novosphingobium sp. MMS21-SN21R TaxID=2969298 RepID=UPI0028863AFB|nr:PepSY domain-containing protein [Novosphingobium sp. MMS21-SN21R]MDT0507949.1 PepSY domain-containing protein [Novosphingobium sp. MMS21-SN21R]
MRFALSFVIAATLASLAPVAVNAQQRPDEQNEVRRDLRSGAVRSLRDIERRVLPTKPGMQYLGPEYDPSAMVYRLKFIRDGRVMFVDVDAKTGQVLGESR